jgi:hypothetical protein
MTANIITLICAPSSFTRLFLRTYPSQPSSRYLMSLGGFDPPPPTLKLSVRSHYATMTRLICAPSSFTRLFLRTYPSQTSLCPSSYMSLGGFDPPPPIPVGTQPLRFNNFHIIVWFRSTSSKLVGTLPLRYNDFVCPHHTHINISVVFKLFTNIL